MHDKLLDIKHLTTG